MRNKIRLLAFVFIFSTCLFIPTLNATAQKIPGLVDSMATVSLDFKDANLKDILKMFSMQAGLNFIASEGVTERKITLYLDKVPVQDAMDELFKANNLSYELNPDNDIFIVKDWGKPKVTMETRVFPLKYATVSTSPLANEASNNSLTTSSSSGTSGSSSTTSSSISSTSTVSTSGTGAIADAVKKFLSDTGSVAEDGRTNSLVVTDIPSVFSTVEKTIKALDVSVPQVMLEVEMLDVSKNVVDQMGIKWGPTPFKFTLTPGSGIATGFPFYNRDWFSAITKVTPATGGSTLTDSANYSAQLDFLRTQTDTKFLARPRILTLNNQPAEIKITTQETLSQLQTTTSATTPINAYTPERMETGVTLKVTPQINIDTGEITMFIMPTVKDTVASLVTVGTGTNVYRDPEERSSKQMVKIRDGDTVILGGLIRRERSETITKLPFLGDIPFLGTLFRHKHKDKDKERELLVFITPHIIKSPAILALAEGKRPVLPMREQAGVAVVDRKRLMNSNLRDFEAGTP